MKFEIRIEQEGEYRTKEVIYGITDSYEDAISLANLILSSCEKVSVTMTARIGNRKESEDNKDGLEL